MLKSIFKIFSSHVLVKVLGLINIAIIISYLSVEDFGQYSYLLLLLHLCSIIIDPYLTSYLYEFRRRAYKTYNLEIAVISTLLAIPFYFILYFFEQKIPFILYLIFFIYFLLSALLKSYLNAIESYGIYGIVDIVRQLSILVSTIVLIYLFHNYNFYSILKINYITALLSVIIMFLAFIKRSKTEFKVNFRELIKTLYDSRFFVVYMTLIPLLSVIDSYFIENYLSEKSLGLYSFSLKIFSVASLLLIPMNTVLNIKQIEMVKTDSYWFFFNRNVKKVIGVAFLILLGCLLVNYGIVEFVFKDYYESIIATSILLLSVFFTYISIPFSFLIAHKKFKTLFFLILTAIIINIIINFIFIESHGILAAAIATLISQMVVNFGSAALTFYFYKYKRALLEI